MSGNGIESLEKSRYGSLTANTLKQVRLNNDASEGRDEDSIAERELPDLIAGCRLFAGILQIYCRLFTGCLLFSSHEKISNPYLGFFSHFHSISA